MATTFTVTTNATSAAQALAAATSALFVGGVFAGGKVVVEASPDNVRFAPILRSTDLASFCDGGDVNGGVVQCALPAGWYVRVRSMSGGATMNLTVALG